MAPESAFVLSEPPLPPRPSLLYRRAFYFPLHRIHVESIVFSRWPMHGTDRNRGLARLSHGDRVPPFWKRRNVFIVFHISLVYYLVSCLVGRSQLRLSIENTRTPRSSENAGWVGREAGRAAATPGNPSSLTPPGRERAR